MKSFFPLQFPIIDHASTPAIHSPCTINSSKQSNQKQTEIMNHPFLTKSLTPDWSLLTPDKIKSDIEYALSEAQKELDSISKQDLNSLNYNNTLLAFELATEDLDNAWTKVVTLDSVANTPELRKVFNELLPKVTEFTTKIFLNPDLWNVLKTYSQSPEAQQLTGARKRFLEELVADFNQSGADLSDSDKVRLESIESELAQITQKFSENVLDATNAWELIIDNEADLAGLPDSAKEDAKESALKKGFGTPENPKWRFTLQAPSMFPVMQYLDNDAIREKYGKQATISAALPPTTIPTSLTKSSNSAKKKQNFLDTKISPTSSSKDVWPKTAKKPPNLSKTFTPKSKSLSKLK